MREGSAPAFRKLVERYIALVNSTALRMTGGNVHLAQDVTQLVFTDLARKAGSLSRGIMLGGWLHRHTCYTALKALRSESRRQKRETIAMEIQTINETSSQDTHWLDLAPVLDEALNRLGSPDRDVIILRYFQQKNIRSIGQYLGASETAVQKRLGRALEKLRAILGRHGVTLASASMLGSKLEAGVSAVVPTGMTTTVSTTAVGSAATLGTGSTLLSLKTIFTSKSAIGFAATLIAVVTTVAIISQSNNRAVSLLAPETQDSALVIKRSAKPAAVAAQVEAPKLPLVPTDTAPATPDTTTAAKVNPMPQNGNLTFTGEAPTAAGLTVPSGNNTYTGGTIAVGYGLTLGELKTSQAKFKQASAGILERRTLAANGDPAELAKVENDRQKLEQSARDRQKQIDDLEALGVTDDQSSSPPKSQ